MNRKAPVWFVDWMRSERDREVKALVTLISVIVAAFTWYLFGR